MLSNRDTEESKRFQDIGMDFINSVGDTLDKLQKLLMNADTMKNKMSKLIQTVLNDPTATTDRYLEALDDAAHVAIIIKQHSVTQDNYEDDEDDDEDDDE